MNDTTEQQNSEANLMTEAEAKLLLTGFIDSLEMENWVSDGLVFLLHSISEMWSKDINVADYCDELVHFVYQNSTHCSFTSEAFSDTIAERYRTSDYSRPNTDLNRELAREVRQYRKFTPRTEVEYEKAVSDLEETPAFKDIRETFLSEVATSNKIIDSPSPQPDEEANRKSLADDSEAHYLQVTANELSHVLNSDKVSEDVQSAILFILTEASNESSFDPLGAEMIHVTFPLLVEQMSEDYSKGVVHSLQAVMRSLPSEVYQELMQYRTSFNPAEKPKVLDLSNASIEDLAKSLSDLMHNPNLPTKLYNCLSDELSEIEINDIHSPESVLKSLKVQKESE